MPKNFRQHRKSSSSEDETIEKLNQEDDQTCSTSIKEKIEELKYLQKQRQRPSGIDVYSLAIGETTETSAIKTIEVLNIIF